MMELTISLSVIILAVMGIRAACGGKLSPAIQYALWGLVPLRTLVYAGEQLFISLPKSRFSALFVAEELARGAGISLSGTAGGTAGAGFTAAGAATPAGGLGGGAAAGGALPVSPEQALFFVWAAGALAVLLWFLRVNIRFYRELTENRRRYAGDGLEGLDMDKISVYVCAKTATPCLAGLFRRAVYLPSAVAQDREMTRFALIHERCHSRHGDLFWGLLRNLMLALFWFNPLVWAAAALSKRDSELACDAAVVREIGDCEKLAYGRALVELVSMKQRSARLLCQATTMWDSAGGIRERVLWIASGRKRLAAAGITLLTLAVAFTAACTFTDAAMVPGGDELTGNPALRSELRELGEAWAEGFCSRDGYALAKLCADDQVFRDFFGMEPPGKDREGMSSIGMSSPWPWDSGNCSVDVLSGEKINVYFVWEVSDPRATVQVQTLAVKETAAGLRVAGIEEPECTVDSAADFRFVYKFGFPWLSGEEYAEALQLQADRPEGEGGWDRSVLTDPTKAVSALLNLEGADVSVREGDDPAAGEADLTLVWKDGTIPVKMIQPATKGESGIWVPASGK